MIIMIYTCVCCPPWSGPPVVSGDNHMYVNRLHGRSRVWNDCRHIVDSSCILNSLVPWTSSVPGARDPGFLLLHKICLET